MHLLRPNDKRARLAMILIGTIFFVEALSLASGILQYILLDNYNKTGVLDPTEANNNDLREQIVGIANAVIHVISIVTFIMWFRRAYYNLHQKTIYLNHSEGWAAGAWFVPFLNLVRPYQIMKELYNETRNLLYEKRMTATEKLSSGFLGFWWALWIGNNVLSQIVLRMSRSASGISELIDMTVWGMCSSIMGIILAGVTFKVIKDYAAAEAALYELDQEPEYEVYAGEDLLVGV